MCNKCFEIWILCGSRPAGWVHVLLFSGKQHLIGVDRNDIGFNQLFQTCLFQLSRGMNI